jgi:hypothetical protein
VDTTLGRVAVDELAGSLPVREFRWVEGHEHYSGWYWSSTMGHLVVYESRLELARVMLADFDPGVAAVAAQPFQLVGADGSRTRRHVPDLLLVGVGGEVTVVDVKAPSKRDDPGVRALMEWTRQVVALRGWGFEEWYGAPPRLLANVAFLAGYRRRAVIDEGLLPRVRRAVGGGSAIADVERSLLPAHPALVRPAVLHLLWCGELLTDLTVPLGGHSVVRPGAGVAVAG